MTDLRVFNLAWSNTKSSAGFLYTAEDYVELDQTQDPVQCILAATDAEADDIWEVKAPFVLGAVFLRKY